MNETPKEKEKRLKEAIKQIDKLVLAKLETH